MSEKSATTGIQNTRALAVFTITLLLAIVMIFFFSTFILVALGMAPTITLMLTDGEPGRMRSHAMGTLNLAGVLHPLGELWDRGATIGIVYDMLRDPFMWLWMYAPAAASLVLMWLGPQIVAAIFELTARRREAALLAKQNRLTALWGAEISNMARTPGRR